MIEKRRVVDESLQFDGISHDFSLIELPVVFEAAELGQHHDGDP
jgi:hypothetical protein